LIIETLAFSLSPHYDVVTAASRAEAVAAIRSRTADLALIDLGLPPSPNTPNEGFRLIGDLLQHQPGLRIVVLTGQNDTVNARRARALGAFDFLAKPALPDAVLQALAATRNAPRAPLDDSTLVGESMPIRKLKDQIDVAAGSAFPVLISGESGTGKERIARALHALSRRAEAPWLALNCAAISPSLIEATLFGHAKGAFTGASQARAGYFEEAGQGTLFLDEVSELPLEAQAKLLRVLENGEFARVGETQTRQARARVVAASNRDLQQEVEAGRFRLDLFHRLSVFNLTAPPLRELGEDKRLLFQHVQAMLAREQAAPAFTLSSEAQELLRRYPFPGNVRELRNIVIRLFARYPGETVTGAQFAAELDASAPARASEPWSRRARADLAQEGFSLDSTLKDIERVYLDTAIGLAQGNMSRAARLLGIGRTTLYTRLAEREGSERPPEASNG
jgi:two-component system nitrogen regulation response regulator GlnG